MAHKYFFPLLSSINNERNSANQAARVFVQVMYSGLLVLLSMVVLIKAFVKWGNAHLLYFAFKSGNVAF